MSLAELWPERPAGWLVYEDADLVVIDKPAGLLAAPEPGRDDDARSRTEQLLRQEAGCAPVTLRTAMPLDRLASGLVVYGRTAEANRALVAQLEQGLVRRYTVGVEADGPGDRAATPPRGRPWDGRTHERSQGSRTRTPARKRRLVELSSERGRRDPREELARAGTPVAGDPKHAGPPAPRLMLHRQALELTHPRTGKRLRVACPLPTALRRWLEVGANVLSDAPSLELTLRAAVERRWHLGADATTNAFRLFNGEGDGVDGLTIDRYGDYLVVLLVGPAVDARELLLDSAARLGPTGVYSKLPPRDPRQSAPLRAALAPPRAVRGSTAAEALWVTEQGLEYEVHLGDGLTTGLFVDQRANRQLVRSLAAGKRILNLFAYTGSFTVAAVAGGAAETVTVDVSRPVLDWAARNLDRALGRPAGRAHQLVRADAFDWLATAARRHERFDLVVLDPPSFATTRSSRFSAASDYGRLAVAALRCVAPGGRLLACTNHRATSRSAFTARLAEAVDQCARHAGRIEPLPDPVDCPSAPGRPCHLKSVLVELAD